VSSRPSAAADSPAVPAGTASSAGGYLPAGGRSGGWFQWAALGVVYVVWGSTYLAIRVVVETVPPLLGMGLRFGTAGLLLAGLVALRGGARRLRVPARRLGSAALVGVFLLLGGNGMVAVAERDVPSGLAALVIAAVPLWVVLLRWLGRDRPAPVTLLGVALGFPGLVLLLLPAGRPTGVPLAGVALVLLASLLWAIGSYAGSRLPMPGDALVAAAAEMVAGGVVLVAVGLTAGERVDVSAVSGRSAVAWSYLVLFGSLLAYTAYAWLLQNAPLSTVATYAYVNPVVAVVLGGLLLDEALTRGMLLGGLLVVASVVAVVTIEGRARRRSGVPA
jgi:drug/metabolite transporter (DMT)-like permease